MDWIFSVFLPCFDCVNIFWIFDAALCPCMNPFHFVNWWSCIYVCVLRVFALLLWLSSWKKKTMILYQHISLAHYWEFCLVSWFSRSYLSLYFMAGWSADQMRLDGGESTLMWFFFHDKEMNYVSFFSSVCPVSTFRFFSCIHKFSNSK